MTGWIHDFGTFSEYTLFINDKKTKQTSGRLSIRGQPRNLRFVTTSIYWEALKKNFYNSLSDLQDCVVNTALWMWELDVDYGSWEAIQAFENKATCECFVVSYRENTMSEHMATGQYPCLTSGVFNCQSVASCHGSAQSVVMIRCQQSFIQLKGTLDGRRRSHTA